LIAILRKNEMSNSELRAKAEKLIKENKWDLHLIELYLNSRHFNSWKQRDDFDQYNFGLINICQISKENVFGKDSVKFLTATFNGVNFMIGNVAESDPTVILYIDEKLVMHCRYVYHADEMITFQPKDHKLISVEEFHSNPKIEKLLTETSIAYKNKERERNQKNRKKLDESFDGKFTFD
jgi:hypothetical protein